MSSVASAATLSLHAVSLLAVVHCNPTPAQQAINPTPPENCRLSYLFWDGDICKMCTSCGPGQMSDAKNCGNGYGERGKCVSCIEGTTYKEDYGIGKCKPCKMCDDNAKVLSSCNTTANTVCGPCKAGYGRHPGSTTLCSRCDDLQGAEKPPECLVTPQPIAETSPPTPTQHTTTLVGKSSTTDLYSDSTLEDVKTAVLNGTTPSVPGNASILAGVIVPVVIICVLIALGWCYCRHKKLPASCNFLSKVETSTTPTANAEPGTSDEREALPTDRPGTPEELACNGGPTQASEVVLNVEQESVQYSAPKPQASTGGDCVILPNTDVPNGVAPTGPEETTDVTTLVMPLDSTNNNTEIPSENGDATQSGVRDSPDGNTSPSILPSIPEESSTSQRERSCKIPFLNEPRPSYQRSISQPVNNKECQEMLQKRGKEPCSLPTKVREKCIKAETKKKEKEFDERFDLACSLGRDMYWLHLGNSVREEVNQRLINGSKVQRSYKDLGEELGLDRNTELKLCQDAKDVFDKVSTKEVPPTMEVVLQILKQIERFDVARTIMDFILRQKS